MSDSVTPSTVAHQAPPSMEFSRQEYGNGLPFPSPGDLPNPEIETGSPTVQADTLLSEPPGKLRIFLLALLIPACASSSPEFLKMYSAYKLNKQGDNTHPWRTPFPIWNQSVVPCPVLTVASWPAFRLLKRQVRWSGIPISLRIFHIFCDPHSQKLWYSQ